jgi:hypothetical protein
MDAPRADRFATFLERLKNAQPASTHDEAFDLIAALLNGVEDEMTSISFNPATWQTDGRMYPPQADAAHDVPRFPDVKRYRSRKHNTFIGANGAIEIAIPPPADGGQTIFSKDGADGKPVQRQ